MSRANTAALVVFLNGNVVGTVRILRNSVLHAVCIPCSPAGLNLSGLINQILLAIDFFDCNGTEVALYYGQKPYVPREPLVVK